MSSTKPVRPTMWCKKCFYPLDGLREKQCPECGSPFDPESESTFAIASPPGECPSCGNQAETFLWPFVKMRRHLQCVSCGDTITRYALSIAYPGIVLVLYFIIIPFLQAELSYSSLFAGSHIFIRTMMISVMPFVIIVSSAVRYSCANSGRYVQGRRSRAFLLKLKRRKPVSKGADQVIQP